ncbi:hypothetical protein NL676_039876 [Syzygium grande]|nr:hypothetical protein NL676_039876 [Syzygium grande]
MVNLGIYLKGQDVADMVKLGTYLEVVDMKVEDKPWEGAVEEDRLMEDKENVVEVGMPLDYMVDPIDGAQLTYEFSKEKPLRCVYRARISAICFSAFSFFIFHAGISALASWISRTTSNTDFSMIACSATI